MRQTINELVNIIKNANKVYIQPHNMPDPDAIASSFGLKQLLKEFDVETEIIYVNVIEKVNSKNMIELFGIEMGLKDRGFVISDDDIIILIDTQLGNSNVTNLKGKNIAVIDHHIYKGEEGYIYEHIEENIGACSTIIGNYYKESTIIPVENVATALLYGIMKDTNDLTRTSNSLDIEIFYWLYGLANMQRIKRLRMNEIGRADIKAYAKALDSIEIYGCMGFVHIENCNDSLLGTISDMVYTIEGVLIVISYAKRKDGVKFSVRCGVKDISADDLVQFILNNKGVGGGHNEMAGGFINILELDFLHNKELDTYVRYRAIAFVEKETMNHKIN